MVLPSVRQWAEDYNVVGGGTGEGARRVVVRVAVGAWAGMLEEFRVHRRVTRVRRVVCLAAAVHWIPERLACALARHALAPAAVPAHHRQLPRASAVQIDQTPS